MGFQSGEMLSHYRLVEKIGEGGMGVVWKADDTVLDRSVAIKVLPADCALDDDRRSRFLDEAKLAASVSHAHIVQVHELGHAEELDFIVMEYVEGQPLQRLLSGRPLAAERVAELGLQIARGLARAHTKKLIHRDLKPANILVTPEGDAKIVDFGLATLFSTADATTASITRSLVHEPERSEHTAIVGTLPYMSPEQVRGEKLDARSDIFSLGSVLYEMTTGQRPFPGTVAYKVAESILRDNPRPVHELVDDLPADLHRIIEKSMARRPADRYQHTDDLAVDLKRLVRDLDSGSSPSYHDVRSGFRRRRKWPLVAATVAGVAIAAGAYLNARRTPPVPPPDQEPSVAVVDFRNLADPDDQTTTSILTSLVEFGLIESSPCRVVALDYLRDLQRRRFGAEAGPIQQEQALDVAREAGATTLLLGDITKRGENVAILWRLVDTREGEALGGRRAQGSDFAVVADSTVSGVVGLLARVCSVETAAAPRSVTQLTTASPEAYRHYRASLAAADRGRFDLRVQELETALSFDSTFALAHFDLGQLDRAWELRSNLSVKDRLRLEAAREDRLVDKVSIYREIQSRWPDDPEGLADLGWALINAWSFGDAAVVLERATRLYPDDANLTTAYWYSLNHIHRHHQAIASVRRFLERNPENANMWDSVGFSFLALGLPDSAETHFKRALAIDPNLYQSLRGLAWCEYARGNLSRAIEIDQRNLDRRDWTDLQRYQATFFSFHGPGLANYFHEAGQFDKAFALHDESRAYLKTSVNEAIHDFLRSLARYHRGDSSELERVADSMEAHESSYVQYLGSLLRYSHLMAHGSVSEANAIVEGWPAWTPVQGGVVDYGVGWVNAMKALQEENPEAALTELRRIETKGNPWGDNNIRFTEAVAKAHRMAGQYIEAVVVLQELIRVYPGHALGHFQLAGVYEDMGRVQEAEAEYVTFLEKWAEADEGLPEVQEALERLQALRAAKS